MPTYKKLVATHATPHFAEAVQIVEEEIPEPGPGEVRVRNRYAGVNATDVNITAGRYAADPTYPMDLGAEVVGVVDAVGEGVEDLEVGDAVATSGIGGGYREVQVVKARHAIPIPDASPEAVSLFVSGLTASIALHEVGRVQAGETVLVTAAAGGTGQYAVQLAKQAGCTVVGTCGSAEKASLLRDLGADRAIDYRSEDLKAALKESGPFDVVYESVGGRFFDLALANLAVRGRLLSIGYIGEYVDGLESVTGPRIYARLLAKSASVSGFFLPHFREFFRPHLATLAASLASGELQVAIDPTEFVGVESVVDAVEHLHSGQSRGKVVVRFD